MTVAHRKEPSMELQGTDPLHSARKPLPPSLFPSLQSNRWIESFVGGFDTGDASDSSQSLPLVSDVDVGVGAAGVDRSGKGYYHRTQISFSKWDEEGQAYVYSHRAR